VFAPETVVRQGSPFGPVFGGLISNVARTTLLKCGFMSFAASPEEDVAEYVKQASALWATQGDGQTPDPAEVRKLMDQQETMLYDLWMAALRNDAPPDELPIVAQAPVTASANPLVLRSRRLKQPVVVMAEGLWSLVSGATLGMMLWADGPDELEQFGQEMLVGACRAWVRNEPRAGPSGMAMAKAMVVDLETTHFAVGLANACFTWAFLHEMGHVYLGHLPTHEVVKGMLADGTAEASSRSYAHRDELQADAFGFERYLGLMPLENDVRRNMPFGPQIDHAPLVLMDLVDLAFRVDGRTDLLVSESHPPPVVRARAMRDAFEPRLSAEGLDWYEYWMERSAAMRRELTLY
jgi:hypothetical protein